MCIEVERLVKRYRDVVALRGISLRIEKGSLVAILGPNGAGKTTLLRAIAGSLRITEGSIAVCGSRVEEDPLAVRLLTGFVAEHPMLFPELSVMDNLLLAARLHGVGGDEARKRIRNVLEELGIWEMRARKYGHLSKGLKRRADIAAALIHEPPVLILDEPSSGLDPLSAIVLRGMVKRLNREKGITIILATHNISEAMSLASHVYILNRGQLAAHGSPEKLRRMLGGRETVIVVELSSSHELVARELLRRGLRVVSEGGVLRIIGSVSEALPALVDAARIHGSRIERIAVKELEWEEVFARIIAASRGEKSCPCSCPASG